MVFKVGDRFKLKPKGVIALLITPIGKEVSTKTTGTIIDIWHDDLEFLIFARLDNVSKPLEYSAGVDEDGEAYEDEGWMLHRGDIELLDGDELLLLDEFLDGQLNVDVISEYTPGYSNYENTNKLNIGGMIDMDGQIVDAEALFYKLLSGK